MDEDKSGIISISEFADYFDAEDNETTRRLIQATLFPNNQFQRATGVRGNLFDFGGFVVSACLVCTYTDDQILWRIFKFFDTDDSGYLEHAQLIVLGKAMQSMASTSNADVFLEAMDANKNGVVDFDEFVAYVQMHPTAFWPVMKIQNLLRKRTLSVESWLILIEAWNSQEKLRADILKRKPNHFQSQIETLATWCEEQQANRKAKGQKDGRKSIAKQKQNGKGNTRTVLVHPKK